MNNNKKVKNVLVTGGSGYIGSILVRKLLEKGYKVRVIDNLIFGDEPIRDVKDKIELIVADIRDVQLSHLEGIDAVIHLAGFSTDPISQYDPRLTVMVNTIATENLAKITKESGIKRFVYASTCSIYFTLNPPSELPIYKETDNINPVSCYGITKRCSEQALEYMTDADFQPTVFRKGTLYGLSPRMRYELLLNSFAKDAFFKKQLTINGGGDIWRSMIDVQDAVAAYIKAIELPIEKVGGKIFNVADKNWNIMEIAQLVKNIAKETRDIDVDLKINPNINTRNYKVDTTPFKETFSFKPIRSIKEVLCEIWDHCENDPNHDPNNPIYYGDQWYAKFFETPKGKKFRRRL
ncbi:MAG: SDR family oxidoreductase [Candidatus Azambacteria bacterium]|nr:SDR family oxidoreductase [Candidatus Azambacteria bacterium]